LTGHVVTATTSCDDLTSVSIFLEVDSLEVTSANIVAANATTGAPSYCDIAGLIGGRIGVWYKFPSSPSWNGRYAQYGCGGACGYNPFTTGTDPTTSLVSGYAVGTTDMGNNASSFSIFHSNFQARVDWAYLSTHLTALAGKMMVEQYYGEKPAYSYHHGGSTGGRQGLVEAERYPGDFDGIVAIAPAYDETGITLQSIAWNAQAAVYNDSTLTPLITLEDAEVIREAVLSACDALDGAVDGIITDPRGCQFNLDNLACSSSLNHSPSQNHSSCITDKVIAAAKQIYGGPFNSDGTKLLPENVLPGSEFAWLGAYISETVNATAVFTAFASDYISNYALWPSPREVIGPMEISMDLPEAETVYMESLHYGGVADLHVFHELGSKMLIFQGLSDPAVVPYFALDFYQRVIRAVGGRDVSDDFVLFYEMPGVGHVSGGPGADTYDALAVVAAWVERGIRPYNITASHLNDDDTVAFTRPLYPYPELAFYSGIGNINASSSWIPRNSTTSEW
ncbi:feruloyl esterase, partial [Xylariales sp. PMI_506]